MDETDRKAPSNYEGFDCDFYTFDPDDAKKFGMKFKHFYYGGTDVCLDGIKIINDVFFVGADKERLSYLKRLQIQFKRLGISYKMIITGTPHKFYSKDDKKLLSPPISYDEVIQSVAESRAVLDITKDGQSGITLRPMEAMMLDKKLVTNNPNVKNMISTIQRIFSFYRNVILRSCQYFLSQRLFQCRTVSRMNIDLKNGLKSFLKIRYL